MKAKGRVCLLGDHNDWAGNCSLAAAIDKGINFVYRKRKDDLISVKSKHLVHGFNVEKIFPLDSLPEGDLKYIGAVVKTLRDRGYEIGGLDLSLISDLPIKKGLSSSAALSVGTVVSFNEAYGLGLDRETIVDIAYVAEHDVLGIGCGRMDQTASAYEGVVYIEFSPFSVEKIPLKKPLYLVIGDTGGDRDTKKILNTLNYYYKKKDPKILETFRQITKITKSGRNALIAEDHEALGRLMNENQKCYDEGLKPFCPEELDSEALYEGLEAAREAGALGAKWTGAGGNGSFIALADGKERQKRIKEYLEDIRANPIEAIIQSI